MKDLIKQILREETSGLTDVQIKAGYSFMNMITKDYYWYYDTPEQPFKFTPGSIWLINPETKEWMLELKISGRLYYYYKIPDSFSKYLNMEVSNFESFIKIWVEDALERGVVSTRNPGARGPWRVEDALERGVISTPAPHGPRIQRVEDALERGVVSTHGSGLWRRPAVEDTLKNGKQLK